MTEEQDKKSKRNRILMYLGVSVLVIAVVVFLLWFFIFQFEESTDDAYVHGNMVLLTPQVPGMVSGFFADDTDFVKQGQLLVQLDPIDQHVFFEERKSDLALAARQVRELSDAVQENRANVVLQEAQLRQARIDYENRLHLIGVHAVAQEEFGRSQEMFEVAEASLLVAKYQLDASIAALGNTPLEEHPLIEASRASLREAYMNLVRCQILAPIDGYVAKRTVQVGEWVNPSQPLMAIIPLEQIWVNANFRETNLTNIRIGQSVDMRSDIYGHEVTYKGKVLGISAGTGSVFSLLPPQNATGNWIKIVQRVPVRVSLDLEQLQTYPLRLGLSMNVTVDTSDRSGKMLATQPVKKVVDLTQAYDIPMEPLNTLMDEIITNNLYPNGR